MINTYHHRFPTEAPKGGKGLRTSDPLLAGPVLAEAHSLVLQAVMDCRDVQQEAEQQVPE